MPKISVIIPVYNVEAYIDKCIQSVLNQTLTDIEIILVDDESPDNCPKICDDYLHRDNRIRVIHKKNEGLGFARNSGMEIATGEYITFVDSDDYLDTCAFAHLQGLIHENHCDAIYYRFNRFSDRTEAPCARVTDRLAIFNSEQIENLKLDFIATPPQSKSDREIECSSCTAIYSNRIIREHKISFHSERELISEDLIFNLDFLSYCTKVAFNASELYHYRINPYSLTRSFRENRFHQQVAFHNYIRSNLSRWGLPDDKGVERNCRLFIGYSRSAIIRLFLSAKPLSTKKRLFSEYTDHPIWNDVFSSYAWKALPAYQRLFNYGCKHKLWLLIFLLSYIKKIR